MPRLKCFITNIHQREGAYSQHEEEGSIEQQSESESKSESESEDEKQSETVERGKMRRKSQGVQENRITSERHRSERSCLKA